MRHEKMASRKLLLSLPVGLTGLFCAILFSHRVWKDTPKTEGLEAFGEKETTHIRFSTKTYDDW